MNNMYKITLIVCVLIYIYIAYKVACVLDNNRANYIRQQNLRGIVNNNQYDYDYNYDFQSKLENVEYDFSC
jgi:hypothetical protein